MRGKRVVALAVVALLPAAGGFTGCGGDDGGEERPTVTVTAPAQGPQTTQTETAGGQGGDRPRGRRRATLAHIRRIARREARGGRIKKIKRDGGGWEVEVERPNGTEVELELDAQGRIIRRDVDPDD
jgi:hypothetical protein